MKKHLALLLTLALALSALSPALALTDGEQEVLYAQALAELEEYVASAASDSGQLERVSAAFSELEDYAWCQHLACYALAMNKITRGEFDDDLSALLDTMSGSEDFSRYLETETGLPPVERLSAYAEGRRLEEAGDTEGAIACYGRCPVFYDTAARLIALLSDSTLGDEELDSEALTAPQPTIAVPTQAPVPAATPVPTAAPGEEDQPDAAGPEDGTALEDLNAATAWNEPAAPADDADEDAAAAEQAEDAEDAELGEDAVEDVEEDAEDADAEEAQPTRAPGEVLAGDVITFGRYEQDNLTANGPEDIEWLVLEVTEDRALLVSVRGLDSHAYHGTYTATSWAECDLRAWLNGEFFAAAFDESEQARVLLTDVDNSPAQCYARYSQKSGEDTQDRVFLLSYQEAWTYFASEAARACKPSAYALANDGFVNRENGNCWWWLRCPGTRESNVTCVNPAGNHFAMDVYSTHGAVRPAMWVAVASGEW